ncbi:acetyl-CoA carboxylase biotin carboxyl carrier protein subunit [Gelidibacter maritimus]|uniref:Acetyl-CoA carboxylase biotin carboxyl carrier protein subunit n=1 Tax=Gelidibacter maritimus TaxID=2761487 RepID=A0A7W2M4F4_9FLAO|nr:acetyl-CoA carboxylase biotin carboxyl carrier protein subunit [Gelidibacter maritimus]MBA6152527.1 acetyl-CoA carboxylase biotin carboxyl carrier protein subunit [Gelidibacter maritimus]
MNKHYLLKVNGALELSVSNDDLKSLDAIKISDSKYHILQDGNSYNAEITDSNFNDKSYRVKINNNTYDIDIFSDLDQLIIALGFEIGNAKTVDKIIAPMPGLILEINVGVGDVVNENDPLLILEAMKMENVISSPRDGIIKSITVNKGDAVEKNQLLITFE